MEAREPRWRREKRDGGERTKMEARETRWRRENQDGGERNEMEVRDQHSLLLVELERVDWCTLGARFQLKDGR